MQSKMNTLQPASDFYLERVGFELKVNMRRNLKFGDNLVGRFNTKDVDIGLDSLNCSREHCMITVSENSVVVKSLNKSNGTSVNGMRIVKDVMVKVQENDTIGIFGGGRPHKELVGNYTYIVYRLCKYSNENLRTIEIDDDDPIEIEDSDHEYVVDLSDSDNEIHSDEEHEVGMQLSRNFNLELKQELLDIDELEEHCKNLKCEPTDYFGVEQLSDDTIEHVMALRTHDADDSLCADEANITEINNETSLYPITNSSIVDTCCEPCGSKDVIAEAAFNDDDSNETVCFAPTSRNENNVSCIEVPNDGFTEMKLDEASNNEYAAMELDEDNEKFILIHFRTDTQSVVYLVVAAVKI